MQTDQPKYYILVLRLLIISVAINGIWLIAGTLLDGIFLRGRLHLSRLTISIPLIEGLTLMYLSSSLSRRKKNALLVSVPVYAIIIALSIGSIIFFPETHRFGLERALRDIALPVVILVGLLYYKDQFKVKSDVQSFRQSIAFTVIILAITFLYGVSGYMLMDTHDFHQEISFTQAVVHTIDQFGLVTTHVLIPHTRRAMIFVSSLRLISVGALAYALISLLQPLRIRLRNQAANRRILTSLMVKYGGSSEDFFKLWPPGKAYLFSDDNKAAIAFHVYRGVALCVGAPVGKGESIEGLITHFSRLCYSNDWLPAFIHTSLQFNDLYRKDGYTLQKIGEEAIVDIAHFQKNVRTNKYFRHINNKFTKLGYTYKINQPPHSKELLVRLSDISAEWLKQQGRAERGFMMGYYSDEYMQICPIMTVSDDKGVVQAFINEIYSFDRDEANFDLLRHSESSPGNINDFLLINFIDYLAAHSFTRINLGLCPLVGLNKHEADHTIIDSTLKFAYTNGDRFYSFKGLHRFKSKYEPQWSGRYVVYKKGIRGFSRTMSSLIRAMSKIPKHLNAKDQIGPHDIPSAISGNVHLRSSSKHKT